MTPPTPHKNWILSIDFGSTSSVVVASSSDRAPSVVEVDGERSVPSVVFIDEDETLVVGTSAVHLGRTRPRRAVRSPKRRLGNRAPLVIGGAAYSSVTLSAAIIRHAATEAIRQQGSSPSEVRLTFPAMWGSGLRTRLIDAAHEAGLEAVRLIPEPIAAAFGAPGTVNVGDQHVIYDLGGGTFDTALLRATSAGFEVVGRPLGTDSVGGELLDEVIMQAVGDRIDPDIWDKLQVADDAEWAQSATQFLAECRRVKEAVSSHPYGEVRVATPDGMIHERVTTEEVEAMVAPHLTETIELLQDVSAGVDLTSIQLVGGGSRMPLVHKMVAEAFPGVVVNTAGDPRVTVALGAAAATHEAGSTRDEGLSPPLPGGSPAGMAGGIPLPDTAPVSGPNVTPAVVSPGGETIAEPLPAGAAPIASGARPPGGPDTLPESEPAEPRRLPMVAVGAFVAVAVIALGSMMVWAMGGNGGGETAADAGLQSEADPSPSAQVDTTQVETDEEAGQTGSTTVDSDSGTASSDPDANVTEDGLPPADDDAFAPDDGAGAIGPFVHELGPNLDGTGTYVVVTNDVDACVEGDLVVRDDATGELGPTLARSSINSVLSEGPQGLLALVEECDGQFVRLRIGSQLGGRLNADTFDVVSLDPMPTRLALLTFDFIRQVPIAQAQFADTGASWTEVQIADDGSVQVLGPSPALPEILLSSEGLTLRDQLTFESDFIGFGADSRTVLDMITPLRAGPGETIAAAGCVGDYEVAQMDGITLTFLPNGQFAGWFLTSDPGGPPLETANGITLGTTVEELEVSGGRFLLDPAESGVGGFHVQIGDDATGTAGLLNGFILDDTRESELLELTAGQNCAALVASEP